MSEDTFDVLWLVACGLVGAAVIFFGKDIYREVRLWEARRELRHVEAYVEAWTAKAA